MGPEALAKALPDVQKFLSEHPNADITVALLGPDNMKDIATLLKDSCPSISADKSYYKVLIKDSDTSSVATVWIDSSTSQTVCATRTSAGSAGKAFIPSKTKVAEEPTQPTVTTQPSTPTVTTTAAGKNETTASTLAVVQEIPKTQILLSNEAQIDLNGDGVWEPVFILQTTDKSKIFKNNVGGNIVLTDNAYLWPTPNGAKAYYFDGKNYIYSKVFETGCLVIEASNGAKVCFYPANGFAGKNSADGKFSFHFPGFSGILDSSDSLHLEFITSPVQFATVFVSDQYRDTDGGNVYSLKPVKYKCVQLTDGSIIKIQNDGSRNAEINGIPLKLSSYVGKVSTNC